MGSERFNACELVVKVAKEVYALVMECGIRQRQRLAGEVGTRLGQIAQESFVTYELDEEAEEAAARLLRTLLEMCIVRGLHHAETLANLSSSQLPCPIKLFLSRTINASYSWLDQIIDLV
jgi:hypothetical protein